MGENPTGYDSNKTRFHGGHNDGLHIIQLESVQHLDHIRALFAEYAESLDFDLDFQNFKDELTRLPGEYAPPEGCLVIAFYHGEPAGCVGLRKLEKSICEMKRLYVRPKYRAMGIGKILAESIIQEAGVRGYKRMRLDTVPSMIEARRLYRSMGFKKIDPYCYNPIQGATFWEKTLG
jgi:ribosomal protein S18 acetylase RimI-like enzyme